MLLAFAFAALSAFGSGSPVESGECRVSAKPRPDVLCVYYPHWHRYPKGDEWFGAERWKEGEWCFVKDAVPRFPGHRQPMVPSAGYLDESDPGDMAKEIAMAADAGIDVFLYDYYYYGGQVTQEEALERGFLGAPNRDRMKFALMWCYHERKDAFRPELEAPRRLLMTLAHTKDEFLGLIDLSIERYFHRPEYYRKDGRLFFSIFNACYFLEQVGAENVRSALVEARERVRKAGLGEIHFNAQNVRDSREIAAVEAAGFDSITHYSAHPEYQPGYGQAFREGRGVVDYGWAVEGTKALWRKMDAAKIPYIPSVAVGWDSSPRCRLDEPFPWKASNYPYCQIYTNNTPDRIAAFLRAAREFAENDPRKPGIVYINGWNEYTEGTYLVPDNFDGDGRLRAVSSVFGRKNNP